MQGYIAVILFCLVLVAEGFLFSSSKCPIKKHKPGKIITGDPLLVHKDFEDSLKQIEKAAKDCKVHVFVKGSYYQLPNPSSRAPFGDEDIVIGQAFQFELRDEQNGILCNKLCLSRNPSVLSEAKCFLDTIRRNGLTWSSSNSYIISSGKYASNVAGYGATKTDIQTKCQKESFKRELMLELRQMYDAESQDGDDDDSDEKKKK
ncbi:unnamed protein product [Rotaria socialis]|uniref:Uncharacterized protein n=1 Tax=Rotaria socialis TaxID=392032 RepID=A0A818JGW1_9BILA|nr:unnamed protein product [Rotaria socialis]CAF3535665.1 unnamed protein product [Rotaria socialis]CAF3557511.1 unnamed protein product [Rotaria socialis]CAF3638418.1 unnamed protein product [Rotaria socialis]CAF4241980.1 unnamed protein product [Rotaria socialis]